MTAFPAGRRVALPPLPLADGSTEAGIHLALHEDGTGPPVVLCHGFPELAFSWRHQLPALAAAGFRALAPDQRGYGGSDRPEPITAYDVHHLTGDLVGLLDALELEKAVFVGHDWGGLVVWAMAVLHPERTAGVVGVNTPYMKRSAVPPTELMRAAAGGHDERMYILWFQEPGVADAVLARHVRLVFEKLMRAGVPTRELFRTDDQRSAPRGEAGRSSAARDMNPFRRLEEIDPPGTPILSRDELEHYVSVFEHTGFTGPLNWYRNFDRNWETAPEIGTRRVEVPSLMITAEWDPVLRPQMAEGMPALVPDLETHPIAECGHWTQQEKPEALNRLLVDWLARRFRQPGERAAGEAGLYPK